MLNPHKNCVPRDVYNDLRTEWMELHDRYLKLVEQVVALKQQGFTPPTEPKQGRVTPAGPTPEELAHRRLIDEMMETGAQQLANARGISIEAARREIERVRSEGLGASIMEPPI